jgi:hypothetical protein
VWGVLVGGGKGNEGDEGEGILLLMNFTYFYETEQRNLSQLLGVEWEGAEGRNDEGIVTNIQYKSN